MIRSAWATPVGGEGKAFTFPLFNEMPDLVGSGSGGFLGAMVVVRGRPLVTAVTVVTVFMGFVAGLANEPPHVILGTCLMPQGLCSV